MIIFDIDPRRGSLKKIVSCSPTNVSDYTTEVVFHAANSTKAHHCDLVFSAEHHQGLIAHVAMCSVFVL